MFTKKNETRDASVLCWLGSAPAPALTSKPRELDAARPQLYTASAALDSKRAGRDGHGVRRHLVVSGEERGVGSSCCELLSAMVAQPRLLSGTAVHPMDPMVLPAPSPATVPTRAGAVALWSLSPELAGLFLAQELPGFGDAAAYWLLRVPWAIGQAWAGRGGLCLASVSPLSLTPGNVLGSQ